MTRLQYRGISYDNSQHEQASPTPVEHTYRGQHFEAPLQHDAAPVDSSVELHYRGYTYHHRQQEAARQVEQH
jgi:hypothetical protein